MFPLSSLLSSLSLILHVCLVSRCQLITSYESLSVFLLLSFSLLSPLSFSLSFFLPSYSSTDFSPPPFSHPYFLLLPSSVAESDKHLTLQVSPAVTAPSPMQVADADSDQKSTPRAEDKDKSAGSGSGSAKTSPRNNSTNAKQDKETPRGSAKEKDAKSSTSALAGPGKSKLPRKHKVSVGE